MSESRQRKLADLVINYSIALQRGENILIECFDVGDGLIAEMIRAAHAAGGRPYLSVRAVRLTGELLREASEEQLREWADYDLTRMKKMHAYVGVRGAHNASELADMPPAKMNLYNKLYQNPVHLEQRVRHTRWVVMRYPSPSMAQLANMSTDRFEDFYYRVCTLDYRKMSRAMDPLKDLLDRTDKVQLKGPGTDLRFSIQGVGSVKCDGHINLPDGELYTAPVKDSVEGTVAFNTPSLYQGVTYENIRLTFEKGRVVKAESSDPQRMNEILDTDAGARYLGEFSLGFNPHITAAMKDTLFDEKIAGSLHLTPGNCYDAAPNGNHSAIHWDLVLIQTPACGGGEIWFDGKLARKDGRFTLPALEGLNPESLGD
ncbi:MAG TPA: aminopeptidase [Candidatus Saccharimonadales bacterium]|nr:aminopeptidase [Candidatus Saccharimonadales bacterium]